MTDSLTPPKRKRGAQPGNRNALKHGFYARGFDRAVVKDLNTRDPHIDDEIVLLRVLMRRFFERTLRGESSPRDLETLRAFAFAAHTIGRLAKISKAFEPAPEDILSSAMDEAIAEIRRERGWK